MKIYVGNLSYNVGEKDLEVLFAEFGEVQSVKIITDYDSGRSKGFGFVEMDDDAGMTAVEQLDGQEFQERRLKVNKARPRNGGGGRGGPRRF